MTTDELSTKLPKLKPLPPGYKSNTTLKPWWLNYTDKSYDQLEAERNLEETTVVETIDSDDESIVSSSAINTTSGPSFTFSTTTDNSELVERSDESEKPQSEPRNQVISTTDEKDTIPGTNITRNKWYYAQRYDYDPLDNTWASCKTWFRVTGKLTVDKPGSFREPYNCEIYCNEDYYKTIGKMMKSKYYHFTKSYTDDMKTQCIAQYYTARFTTLIKNKLPHDLSSLRMLAVSFFELYNDSKCDNLVDMINVEAMKRDDFIKFTNKAGYVCKKMKVDIALAFSHYTYHESGGKIIVMDLQGFIFGSQLSSKSLTLTDPVVTSLGRGNRFGRGDLGQDGFNSFWTEQHPECNKYCKVLGFERPVCHP